MDITEGPAVPGASIAETAMLAACDPTAANNLATFLTRWQQDAVMVAHLLADNTSAREDAIAHMDTVRGILVGEALATIEAANGNQGANAPVTAPIGATPTDTTGEVPFVEDAPVQPAPGVLPDGYVTAPDDLRQFLTPDPAPATADPTPARVLVPGRDHPIDQPPPAA